jgi:hypothetical protein
MMLTPQASPVMQPKDWIPVIGWFVVFILGIISGGVVVPRLTLKRKVLAWFVAAETELVPRELSETLGVPVVLQVGAERPSFLRSVVVVLACTGNEILENLSIVLRFGENWTKISKQNGDKRRVAFFMKDEALLWNRFGNHTTAKQLAKYALKEFEKLEMAKRVVEMNEFISSLPCT